MRKKAERRLRGASYQKLKGIRHILARDLEFTDAEYRLFDMYLALHDWDKNHTETYMTIEATDVELSEILIWSPSKVSRTRELLSNRGIVSMIESGWYKLHITDLAQLKNHNSQLQNENAPVHQKDEAMHGFSGENANSTIVSNKDSNSYSGGDLVRGGDQYSGGNNHNPSVPSLPEDDIQWINENLKF